MTQLIQVITCSVRCCSISHGVDSHRALSLLRVGKQSSVVSVVLFKIKEICEFAVIRDGTEKSTTSCRRTTVVARLARTYLSDSIYSDRILDQPMHLLHMRSRRVFAGHNRNY